MPDEVYRRARVAAAERDRSVSALVSEFLAGLGRDRSEVERRKRLQAEVLASVGIFSAADRLSRDAVHERDAVR